MHSVALHSSAGSVLKSAEADSGQCASALFCSQPELEFKATGWTRSVKLQNPSMLSIFTRRFEQKPPEDGTTNGKARTAQIEHAP
jgi:hypothetical protein